MFKTAKKRKYVDNEPPLTYNYTNILSERGSNMEKIKTFLDSKIIKSGAEEGACLTWRETLSYALGRGAQGMCTGMTSSKYVNFFITNILFKTLKNEDAMSVASRIRFYCGIFDAVNDPVMGVIVDRTRTKNGQMRPYIKWAPFFVAVVMVMFFVGSGNAPLWLNILYTTVLFIGLDVTYTAFDIPMGALAFSITPDGVERTKLFGVSSIVRSVVGAVPMVFVAGASLLPYFKSHTAQSYLVSACVSAAGIIILTRFTYKNTKERVVHHEDTPSVKTCFSLLFKNQPLMMLFLANIAFVFCKIPEQVSAYFVSDLMFNRKYNIFIDVIKFPGSLLAGLFVPLIIRKFGKRIDTRRFYQLCCVGAVCIHVIFALVTCNGLMQKQPEASVSLLIGIMTVLFTGLSAIPMEFKNLIQKEMEAETVDYVEYKTGTRVEGVMLSIMSFTGKLENTFSASIGLNILSKTGYIKHEEGSVAQNDQTRWALFIMTTLIPVVGYLLMLVPMHFYKITGRKHREMLEELTLRRAAIAEEEAEKETV